MELQKNGIDIFYVDESNDRDHYVLSAVTIPFLRPSENGYRIVWDEYFKAAKTWRNEIKQNHDIPLKVELHAVKLVSGRGQYRKGKHSFQRPKASSVYRDILRRINFLEDGSIFCCTATTGAKLYDYTKLEASLYALFQRMRRQCQARKVNAFIFFDEGHPEYRKLYRKAQIYLPTGNMISTGSRSLPLDMFVKDANEKQSKHCFFTQMADLISYAAFLKLKDENGTLTPWQNKYNLGTAFDEIPLNIRNTAVSGSFPKDGIVRLK